jgi:hypothetical protein
MRYASDELERPTEWLRRLAENRALYRLLLEQAGSLAVAAYRLARARCRTQPMPMLVPTATEVRVAADEISRYVGLSQRMGLRQLLDDCEHAGLTVIVPLSLSAA